MVVTPPEMIPVPVPMGAVEFERPGRIDADGAVPVANGALVVLNPYPVGAVPLMGAVPVGRVELEYGVGLAETVVVLVELSRQVFSKTAEMNPKPSLPVIGVVVDFKMKQLSASSAV